MHRESRPDPGDRRVRDARVQAEPVRHDGGPGAAGGRGLPDGAVRDRGAGLRDQHLHRDGPRRLLGPPGHPPRRRAESRRGGRRHRMLRADQPGCGRGDPRGGPGPRHPGQVRAAGAPRPGPEARPSARPGERRLRWRGRSRRSRSGDSRRATRGPSSKVQDGCQHRCSFCIVPFARGGSRSQALERRGRADRGARGRRLRGGRPHRRGSRPLRLGPQPADDAGGARCGGSSTSAGSPGSACPPCCPPTSPRS